MKLTRSVQQYIENIVQELKGEEDFPPFVIIEDSEGDTRIVETTMPDEPEGKDKVADVMTALCTIHRVTQAAFAGIGYMMKPTKENEGLRPSQDPNRVEVVMLNVVDAEDTILYTADLIRENNLVAVGLWEPLPEAGSCYGRFAAALSLGVSFGQILPKDMTDFFDSEMAAGRERELVAMVSRAIATSRSEVAKGLGNALGDVLGYE